MSAFHAVLLSIVLHGCSPRNRARPLATKVSCVYHANYDGQPSGLPSMMWVTVRPIGIETIHLYPDGYFILRVRPRPGEIVDCNAKLSPERLATFRSELVRTKVWESPTSKGLGGYHVTLYLDLDPARRCHLEMTPAQWAESPPTRAVQAAIDRLKLDVCEGECPEEPPGNPLLP